MSENEPLVVRRVLGAPRERVFKAWTDPEQLKRWWRVTAEHATVLVEADLKVGGRYRLAMRSPDGTSYTVGGEYREIAPPERLLYTWKWEHEPDFPDTVVTVEFRERGEYTEVVLTHERLPGEDSKAKHRHGWLGCLEQLSKIV